jgi:hypothetical protein
MALQIAGQTFKTGAAGPVLPQDQQGALLISEFNARYAAETYAGNVFFGANNAAQALSVASTTFTGLAVSNPAGSGKNLIIIDFTVGIAAALAVVATPVLGYAGSVSLTTGASTGPTGLNSFVGTGAASVAKVGASATLNAAPTVLRPVLGLQWVTGGTSAANIYAKDEIAGAIIIPPGQLICVQALTAAATVVAAFTWLELPI